MPCAARPAPAGEARPAQGEAGRDQGRAAQAAARQPEPRRARHRDASRSCATRSRRSRPRRWTSWASCSTATNAPRLNQDLYDEVTGLGPLEALLKDDTVNDILVNGPHQIFVERGGQAVALRHHLQGRAAPAADHRQDRLGGGPAGRRVEPLRRRPPRRRQPLQRDGAADRGGRQRSSRSASSRRKSSAIADLVRFGAFSRATWRATSRRRWPRGSTSSSRAAPARARRRRSTRCRPSSTIPSGS